MGISAIQKEHSSLKIDPTQSHTPVKAPEVALLSFQSRNDQTIPQDMNKKVQAVSSHSLQEFQVTDEAFKQLMGVDYQPKSNLVDNWIYGLLHEVTHNDVASLKARFEILNKLHPHNQNAILSAVYYIATQKNHPECCHLASEIIDLPSLKNIKFDLAKENYGFLSHALLTQEYTPWQRTAFKTVPFLMISLLTGLGLFNEFLPTYKCIANVPGNLNFTHGIMEKLSNLPAGAVKKIGLLSGKEYLKMAGEQDIDCLVRVNNQSIFSVDYLPYIIGMGTLGSIGILGAFVYLAYQGDKKISLTLNDFMQRNEPEEAVELYKKYKNFITDEQLADVGFKAIEQGKMKLAQEIAQTMSSKEISDKLYETMLSKIKA